MYSMIDLSSISRTANARIDMPKKTSSHSQVDVFEPLRRLDRKLENQQNGSMKTTLDLPDALLKQVKHRAIQEGRKLKDAVADLLRKGLAAAKKSGPDPEAPLVIKDKQTGLPLVQCKHAASPHEELTAERVADILLTQETDWHHALGR
jgi:hypothetical protein